jgi:3-hydroxybutyryl-CoA dehydrogenase
VSQLGEKTGSKDDRAPAASSDELLGIAGSGTIACGLAACAAGPCRQVLIWARSEESAARAREQLAAACEKLGREDVAGRVEIVGKLRDLSEVTLAIEAVSEEQAVKAEVLGSLGGMLGEGAVIATTTSSLRIEELARTSGRPGRFLGLHVFNPVERMELVELCFPPGAEADTKERAKAFCAAIGKTAVEVPDETGFVVNRLLFPYLFEAVRLLERTGLEPADIDTCMKLGASHPLGPLELLDLVGLDVADSIGEALHADSGESDHLAPQRIKSLVREGRLGRKSGAGFHSYEQPRRPSDGSSRNRT